MKRYATWAMLICVAPLVAACATGSASDGAGYELLTPNSGTRTFITQNDKTFAQQVAAHNVQCKKDEACEK